MVERIQALGVKKSYQRKAVLDCSVDFRRGPLYSVIGPNGSGKSTLLRLLSLIEPPDSGSVVYSMDGVRLTNPHRDTALRRRAVLVTARAGLFQDTVYGNVAYGLRMRGYRGGELREQALATLDEVKLYDKRKDRASHLSSGEAQRLAMARAMALRPQVLLLDEPTASHDPPNTRLIEGIIQEWRRQSEGIVVVVTHSMFQARRLSEVVTLLYEGRVVETAPTAEFFASPATDLGWKFVAGEIY